MWSKSPKALESTEGPKIPRQLGHPVQGHLVEEGTRTLFSAYSGRNL
jgi:hypothetical protein